MKTLHLLAFTAAIWTMAFVPEPVAAQCAKGTVTLTGFTSTGGQGTYADPATGNVEINFCFTLTDFFESNTNWAHGIYVAWEHIPPGAVVCPGPTGEQNAQHGSRKWIFIDSTKAAIFGLPGPGFYVDEGDGNPRNNYGDNGIGTPNAKFPDLDPFCFKVKIDCGKTPPTAFLPQVTVTGDGTTGGWSNPACTGDVFRAIDGGPNGNGTVVVCGVVLPVKLLQFRADAGRQGILVRWTASADNLFSHFELEKSSDDGTVFRLLSKIDVRRGPIGGSNEIFDYSYLDGFASSFNAYRLKLLEKDGTYRYSPIISVSTTGINSKNSFSVFPNPALDMALVRKLTDQRYPELTVKLYNAEGRTVDIFHFDAAQSNRDLYLDIAGHTKGHYLLEVSTGDQVLETLDLQKF
ncbi:MAG: T9SS type A sorting domain-containing protein [Saprospiraceae bacterium]|jgi:hypothetical protein|nr:T9SS type A sorting domain-containing protein [Saprospiraceae bacterium]MBP9209847.1 T9SS type A sorting domain-containing protein [Saprospiraceae bacterium]MBV6473743.1 hypothetical protein [Saprospiraceae bacterium]